MDFPQQSFNEIADVTSSANDAPAKPRGGRPLPHAIAGDRRLGLRAMAILAHAWPRADRWRIAVKPLQNRFNLGRDAVRRELTALADARYLATPPSAGDGRYQARTLNRHAVPNGRAGVQMIEAALVDEHRLDADALAVLIYARSKAATCALLPDEIHARFAGAERQCSRRRIMKAIAALVEAEHLVADRSRTAGRFGRTVYLLANHVTKTRRGETRNGQTRNGKSGNIIESKALVLNSKELKSLPLSPPAGGRACVSISDFEEKKRGKRHRRNSIDAFLEAARSQGAAERVMVAVLEPLARVLAMTAPDPATFLTMMAQELERHDNETLQELRKAAICHRSEWPSIATMTKEAGKIASELREQQTAREEQDRYAKSPIGLILEAVPTTKTIEGLPWHNAMVFNCCIEGFAHGPDNSWWHWPRALGPEPGSLGCKIPPRIIELAREQVALGNTKPIAIPKSSPYRKPRTPFEHRGPDQKDTDLAKYLKIIAHGPVSPTGI